MSSRKLGSVIESTLKNDFYFDLQLADPSGEIDYTIGDTIIEDGLIVHIDTNEELSYNGKSINSLVSHPSAITRNYNLSDASLTLVDNRRFTEFSGETSELKLTSADTFLSLYPVSGDRRSYYYETASGDSVGRYVELYGGYFQGFYKLEGYDYQVLPSTFKDGWTLDFWLKFRYCEEDECVPYYDLGFIQNGYYECDDSYVPDCLLWGETGVTFGGARNKVFGISEYACEPDCIPLLWGDTDYSFSELEQLGVTFKGNLTNCIDNNDFIFYWGHRTEDKFHNRNIIESGKTTSENIPLQNPPYSGTVNLNRHVNSTFPLTGITSKRNEGVKWENVNRTTAITDNNFAIKLTKDGRLGYRKVVGHICEYDYKIPKIEERYSSEPIFRGSNGNGWVNVSVTYTGPRYIEQLEGTGCTIPPEFKDGRLEFYVQGLNVLTVDEFTNPFYEGLDIHRSLQIGVPYTMSVGGGSQGLFENKSVNNTTDKDDYGLLIEKWFNGSFNGGISTFRMYNKPLSVDQIRHNYNKTKTRYKINDSFGGRVFNISRYL